MTSEWRGAAGLSHRGSRCSQSVITRTTTRSCSETGSSLTVRSGAARDRDGLRPFMVRCPLWPK